MIGRVHRRIVAGRAVALGDEADHRLAIDGQRQRLAHADVVERLLIAAHVDVAGTGRTACAAPSRRRALASRAKFVAGVVESIRSVSPEISAEASAVRSGIDQHLDAIEIGPRRVVIGWVARDDDLAVGLVGDELERPGAVRRRRQLARSPAMIAAGTILALV